MSIGELQSRLESCYEIDLPYRVEDFLTTDRALAELFDGDHAHRPRERLLMQQSGDELSMSLYLDAELLDGIGELDWFDTMDRQRLADLALILEGVSHFVYMAWNASHHRPVSLLEMELQAEVDKFVTLLMMQDAMSPETNAALHRWLFEDVRFADTLDAEQRQRYRTANRFAARYCWSLIRQYRQKNGSDWYNELRRFYRLQHDAKLRRISTLQ